MDTPATEPELVPDKIENVIDSGPSFHCDLSDTDVVHKIAQEFLPGLATACVDNTTGGLFRSPASVAVDMRKEMADYLTQRSETFVAESIILEDSTAEEVSDHPLDIITNFIDDFAGSKRNFFSRVSGWLLSESREDKIDDFVQEMEINGFWPIDRREVIAQNLLKNVDFNNIYHCDMKFPSTEELTEHGLYCKFRTMSCTSEGCTAKFIADHMEKHDAACPFQIIPCEQKCSESIRRQEMDRHCLTVCPMKLVNCPFYSVGCQSAVPYCQSEEHRSENIDSHMLYILQVIHKEASPDDLKKRVQQLKNEASSPNQLAQARDAKSLTNRIKALEAKIGPLEVSKVEKVSEEAVETANVETSKVAEEN